MPPQRDQEVHRHQHHFPQREEQEQVQRHEHAHDAGQIPQQVQMKEADVLLDLPPRAGHRQHAEHAGQQNHQQAQTVDPEVEGDPPARNPVELELQQPDRCVGSRQHTGDIGVLPDPQRDDAGRRHRQQPDPARPGQRQPLGIPRQQTADERDRDQRRQQPGIQFHRTAPSSSTMPSAIATAYQPSRPVCRRSVPRCRPTSRRTRRP